ncbi:hypothetical protein UFOVP328_108 [uncultured Caudovirales phage]|uniref:Uncharacterized protein n=1 Tax=uncultured Caudovirales phage TaxID=2100421 RepID=A0A6J5LTS8_9CAUD|nr:hypothetical protein UFOVP328_108 [uncultured Caudovirales phage]
MIKTISTGQPQWLTVNSFGTSTPYGDMSNGVNGQLRLNVSSQQYEVFVNGVWQQTGASTTVEPTQRMVEILTWAERMMHMESEIMQLVDSNPTVADAYNTYKQAESQLKMVANLVKQ